MADIRDRVESGISNSEGAQFLSKVPAELSAAISLKRIADALDILVAAKKADDETAALWRNAEAQRRGQ